MLICHFFAPHHRLKDRPIMLLSSEFSVFQQRFKTELSAMLSPDELGAFVLVLANSLQDCALEHGLATDLRAVFRLLLERDDQGELNTAPDDLVVFKQLRQTNIDVYTTWTSRRIDSWECVFNPLRALRPTRSSSENFTGLNQRFNEEGFHFDKVFLKPEILSEEVFQGKSLRVLFHKFPFVAYHLLILPLAEKHYPQFLDEKMHALAWDLVDQTASNIPNFGAAFNSLGAGASVNHLHLHGFIQQSAFAIEDRKWQHNGGTEVYPVSCCRFSDREKCWAAIAQLHAQNQPYNLLFRLGLCYVIIRAPQGERTLPAWMSTAGWYELCGAFNLSDLGIYESLTADEIVSGLEFLRV